jgi:hypothetical protein
MVMIQDTTLSNSVISNVSFETKESRTCDDDDDDDCDGVDDVAQILLHVPAAAYYGFLFPTLFFLKAECRYAVHHLL